MTRPLLAAILLVMAACGGGEGPTAQTTVPGDGSTTTEGGTQPTAATSTTQAAEDFEQLLPDLGLPGVELLTATSGGGSRPILEWAAVDGAVAYYITVLDPAGGPYWAWRTDSTSVPVGGEPRLDEDVLGPAVSDGMSWFVTAFDAEGTLVAVSAQRPISP